MSAIKEFFKKKKVEAQFKLAGGGHKLGVGAFEKMSDFYTVGIYFFTVPVGV